MSRVRGEIAVVLLNLLWLLKLFLRQYQELSLLLLITVSTSLSVRLLEATLLDVNEDVDQPEDRDALGSPGELLHSLLKNGNIAMEVALKYFIYSE